MTRSMSMIMAKFDKPEGKNETKQEVGAKYDKKSWLPLAIALMEFQRIAAIREAEAKNKRAFAPGKKRGRGDDKLQKEEEKVYKKRVKRSESGEKVVSESTESKDVPSQLKTRIAEKEGTEVKLVISKRLFESDLSSNHGRLSIPLKQIKDHSFLKDDERQKLDMHEELQVKFMEPCGHESKVVMKKWAYENKRNGFYALRTGWNGIVARNLTTKEEIKEFKANDKIQIWSFRTGANQELWFTICKVQDANNSDDEENRDPVMDQD